MAFLTSQPDFNASASIKEKYNTFAASQYREKLAAEADGRTWTPGTAKQTSALHASSSNRSISSLSNNNNNFGSFSSSSNNASNNNASSNNFALPSKAQTEEYFNRKQMENQLRSA